MNCKKREGAGSGEKMICGGKGCDEEVDERRENGKEKEVKEKV